MRTPQAEGLDVVLVGSFNPAIFHPEWFLRQGIIPDQDAKEAEIEVVSGQVASVKMWGMRFQCLSDRFSIGTRNVSLAERLQDIIHQTFSLLRHTPITACGINPWAQYEVSSTEYWHKIGHTLAPKELVWNELLEKPGMQSLTIKASRHGEFPGETNVIVEPSVLPLGIVVRSNYHYGLPRDSTHAGACDLALKFIGAEWKPACGMARKVAEQIFTKIRPEND